ncbi:MAG: efflux RND transporter periplasmic adaptor subunit [Halioglobus sp.]|nr:efflux RND transporter periplasmic adaptor subunit [Halioglobus sp.]
MKVVLCAVLFIFIAACGDAVPESATATEGRITKIRVEQPVQRDIEEVLTALGSIESIDDPTVSAETSGQVQQIDVHEGDAVGTGQLLAALDDTVHAIETAKAAAEVRRYDVLVQNQENEVKRLQRLDESQSVSRDTLEDEQAQLEMLAAERDIARKQWEHARYMESKTRVTAPLQGLVTRRYISPGDYVSAGQPLFDLVSVDRLRARIAFPERNAARVVVGEKVYLQTPAAPDITATGEVAAVNPQIKTHNRAVEIIVEFDNPGGWLPGASVDARLVVERRAKALTLPLLALANREGRDVVFVATGSSVRAVPITAGWREAGRVEILSGITPDDRVVVEGASMLSDGSQVSVESAESAAR